MVKQHQSKSTGKLLKELEGLGFEVSGKSKRGGVKILPPKGVGGPPYFTHATESAYHQLRRDVARLYKVSIGN